MTVTALLPLLVEYRAGLEAERLGRCHERLDGNGLEALKGLLEARLLGDAAGEETWVSSERHVDALRDAIAALDRLPSVPHDLQGLDLETALRALDRITGLGDVVETTLSEVFERFCVGK